ncbi:MAG TPA: response regulator [Clostridiales bacterium]|nr:response regulator [Clostridiales bacterium]HPV01195.1 response regulator [Clostridiales bacterium]
MKRVLIVDDAAFMRASIRTILERNGFEVVGEAENGAIGVKKYQELHPDIVTMDITMPEMTGLEALKQIRSFDPDAKVIMITAMGQEHLVKEAILSGAKSFIVKPFKEDHVIQTLKKI